MENATAALETSPALSYCSDMKSHRIAGLCLSFTALLAAGALRAQEPGSIAGRVLDSEGRGLPGVAVTAAGAAAEAVTDGRGGFTLAGLAPGSYDLELTLREHVAEERGVAVVAGAATPIEIRVDWPIVFADTLTVYSAARRAERIVEAPAAITLVPQAQIDREATHGQIPKLLEFTPGAEVSQGSLYDFNLNARGFNGVLNRRLPMLVDGRDTAVPFLGAQAWATHAFRIEELASAELVRGPGSALYGADAFNGVLNVVTRRASDSQGGAARLTLGDLATRKVGVRWAGAVAGDRYLKITAGYQESDLMSLSRDPASGGPEYQPCGPQRARDCLPPEAAPLFQHDLAIEDASVRLEQPLGAGQLLTVEAGLTQVEGNVNQTSIGRTQILDSELPWFRADWSAPHWNLLAYYNSGKFDFASLASGQTAHLANQDYQIEMQGNVGLADGRGRLVAGASLRGEEIDTATGGRQSLLFAPRNEDFQGLFAQLDWAFGDSLHAVLAARLDDSSLYDSQFSPQASLVWAATPEHTLRTSYREGFLVPSYSNYFLAAPVAPPADLSPFEAICALASVSCGFGSPVPVLGLGDPAMRVETISAVELGYTGVLGRRAFVTVDLYRNEIDDFVTDLILRFQPELGGNINSTFGAYAPPASLPGPLQELLLQQLQLGLQDQFFFLTNAPDGSPILAPVSHTNFGRVRSEGAEVGFHYSGERWRGDLAWSRFDYEVERELAASPLVPNTPPDQVSAGVSYLGERFDASLRLRHAESFRWNGGGVAGPVPAYDVVGLNGNWMIDESWQVGLDVANLLDEHHYQSFGGDRLRRRALAYVRFGW